MSSTPLLESLSRRLLLVSGKGGVGKTTVAATLAKLAAVAGRRVLLVSTDGRGDAAALFEKRNAGYREVELAPRLHGLTADFDALLADFVDTVSPLKMLGDRLLAVPAFRFFTRATPGLPGVRAPAGAGPAPAPRSWPTRCAAGSGPWARRPASRPTGVA